MRCETMREIVFPYDVVDPRTTSAVYDRVLDKTGDFQLFDDAFGRDGWEHGGRQLRYLPNGTWFCQVHLKITAQQTLNECHVLRRAHNYLVIAGISLS